MMTALSFLYTLLKCECEELSLDRSTVSCAFPFEALEVPTFYFYSKVYLSEIILG